MKILRGKCTSASSSSDIHRVKVTVDGVCDNLLMDVSNGIYLRTGDEVFVAFEDDFNSPLVLGRCSGQLELQDLFNVISKLIDVVNADKKAFESHIHDVPAGQFWYVSAAGTPTPCTPSPATPTVNPTTLKSDSKFGDKIDTIKIDDLLY